MSTGIKRLILYSLIFMYIVSFFSSLVISIIIATGHKNLSNAFPGQSETPILGQLGPISTVILLVAMPLLILITAGGYAYSIGAIGKNGIKL